MQGGSRQGGFHHQPGAPGRQSHLSLAVSLLRPSKMRRRDMTRRRNRPRQQDPGPADIRILGRQPLAAATRDGSSPSFLASRAPRNPYKTEACTQYMQVRMMGMRAFPRRANVCYAPSTDATLFQRRLRAARLSYCAAASSRRTTEQRGRRLAEPAPQRQDVSPWLAARCSRQGAGKRVA